MANYGKYYIAVRLLLLKQYLKVNAGKTRIIRAVHPHFVNKTPLKRKNRNHIILHFRKMMYFLLHNMKRADPKVSPNIFSSKVGFFPYFFKDSSTATATETVLPTMGAMHSIAN